MKKFVMLTIFTMTSLLTQAQDVFEIGFTYGDLTYRGLFRTNSSTQWVLRMKGYFDGRVVVFIEENIRATQQKEGLKLEGSNVRKLSGNLRKDVYDADNFYVTQNYDGSRRFSLIDNAGRSAPVECVQIGPSYIKQKLQEYGW